MPALVWSVQRTLLGVLILCTIAHVPQLTAQTVETIDKQKLRTLITERNNRPLLLNIWATWCTPCVEEFPDIIRVYREHSDVDVVAISADYPDEIEEKIQPFLRTMNVPFSVYVADFADQDEFFSMFDSRWGGEIPATFIYDHNGNQTHFLKGKQTFADFKKAVEEETKKR